METRLSRGRKLDFEEDETRTLRRRKRGFEEKKKGNRESCNPKAVFS